MMTPFTRIFAICAVGALLAACATPVVEKEKYSGFLKDYSQLKVEKDAAGADVLRHISPKLSSGQYRAVMIDPVVFYPAPTATDDVDSKTLSDIRGYLDKELREKIGAKASVVNQLGPGVVRMRVAITAVGSETVALKAYQYIPVALVIQGIKSAAGARAKEAELYAEVELLDSQSGERLGAVVKKGVGTQVKTGKEETCKVAIANLTPVLDQWAQLAAEFAGSHLRASR